jgi:lysophospholipase L1-like esterase
MKKLILLLLVFANVEIHGQILLRGIKSSKPLVSYAQAAAYEGIYTGSADFGGVTNAWFINYANHSRIAQTGNITKIEFYVSSKPTELTNLYFTVWRKDGSTYDLINSVDILSLVTSGAGIKTITLPTPMAVQVGDITGMNWLGSTTVPLFLSSIHTADACYYFLTNPGTTNVNWFSGADGEALGYIPIQVYIKSPTIIFTGDSYPSGYPLYYPPADGAGFGGDITYSFPWKVANEFVWSFQNVGIGAETSVQIQARFKTDVTDKKPKYVVIDGGGNDIPMSVSAATTVASIRKMLDSCNVHGIQAFYLSIPPFNTRTNLEMQDFDDRNDLIEAECIATGAIFIDCRPVVGQFRSGGDVGNFWDVNSAYNSGDGVHLNNDGYEEIKDLIVGAISTFLGL